MKLSEAITLSIGVVNNNPSIFLAMNDWSGVPGPCGCAIGTALYSAGYRSIYELVSWNGVDALIKVWPWTAQKLADGRSIAGTISDRHSDGESRESIAAWVATIEPQEVSQLEEQLQHDTCRV
jgi:hypothetical protein